MNNETRLIPPQSIEAEMSVLGAILVQNDAIAVAREIITVDDLYREAHRKIFNSMVEMTDRKEPIDLVTLNDVLKKRGELEEVGGGAYLTILVDYTPTAANIAYYCRIIREKSTLRQLSATSLETIARVRDGQPVGEVIDEARRSLERLIVNLENAQGINSGDLLDFKDRASGYFRYVKQLDKLRFSTGFDLLDKEIRGVAPGEVLTIAAYSGTFKTALLQHLLLHSARATGLISLLFSLEMPAPKLFEREASMQSVVTGHEVEHAWYNASAAGQTIFNNCIKNGSQGLLVCERPKLGIDQIARYITAAKRKGAVGAVGIDYLGLMYAPGKSLFERTAFLAPELKNLAKAAGVPLIVLSQINREAAKSGAEIEAHSAKGGGDIEASCDFMLGLQFNSQQELVLRILKNRNGRSGVSFLVELDRTTFQFRGLTPYTPPKAQRGKGLEL